MTPDDSYHFESMFTDCNPKEDKMQICASCVLRRNRGTEGKK